MISLALVHDGEGQARVDTPAVHVNRACPALPVVAALLRAGKLQVLAERVEQSDARLDIEPVFAPVDLQSHGHEWFGGG